MDRDDLNYAAPEAQGRQVRAPGGGRFGTAQRAASVAGGGLRAQSTNPMIRKQQKLKNFSTSNKQISNNSATQIKAERSQSNILK
jgi:hypothetical protein